MIDATTWTALPAGISDLRPSSRATGATFQCELCTMEPYQQEASLRKGRTMKRTTLLIGSLAVLTLWCGCATMGRGMSDEERVRAVLVEWKAAFAELDIDAIMEPYSEDYAGPRGTGKQEVREFIDRAIRQGSLEEMEMDIENAEITVDGDTAVAAPVTFSGDFPPMRLTLELKKEDDGCWRFAGSDVAR